MSKLTRRKFVAGASAIPFSVWLHGCNGTGAPSSGAGGGSGTAGGPGPDGTPPPPAAEARIRYDARSADGQRMLGFYRTAVDKMQTLIQEEEPISWVFQWYIHGVKSSTSKAAEIARLYPDPGPHRDLAEEVWNTCQAHYPGDDENFFLPWHRMYIYFFESIIREASGEPTFTLPYWNYSTTDLATRGVLPEEFRLQDSSLFVGKRNPGVNDGAPIQGNDQSLLSLDSLEQCTYKQDGAKPGFNMALDFGLHGNIHVRVGNRFNMGAVPWAAGDPIFWMHHCNIDRLWASWNAGGRTNPTDDPVWMDKSFVFADATGTRVETQVRDVTDIASLDYEYDQLEPVPACEPEDDFGPASAGEIQVRGSAGDRVSLASTAMSVRLAPEDEFSVASELEEGKELYVQIKGLEAQTQPEVVYLVYYGLPDGVEGEARDAYLLGSVNFFGAVPHDHGDGHDVQTASADVPEKFVSFNATAIHRRLVAEQAAGGDPKLTIVPLGEPAENAEAVLGEVLLVEQ